MVIPQRRRAVISLADEQLRKAGARRDKHDRWFHRCTTRTTRDPDGHGRGTGVCLSQEESGTCQSGETDFQKVDQEVYKRGQRKQRDSPRPQKTDAAYTLVSGFHF